MDPRARLESVRAMAIDQQTAEVCDALAAAGIDALVLKGPTFARLLYDAGEVRGYVDSDVLVAPARFADARRVLGDLGFAGPAISVRGMGWRDHADTLTRPGGAGAVDLHWTFHAMGARERVFEVAWRDRRPITVGGSGVFTCSEPFAALAAALHADGGVRPKPREDLARAVVRLSFETWRGAVDLAAELDAAAAMAIGLRQVDGGAELAQALGLRDDGGGAWLRLRAIDPSNPAVTLARIAAHPSWLWRVGVMARKVVPSPSYVRHWDSVVMGAKDGTLLGAYARRVRKVAADALPALRAYRRAAREGRHR